MDNDNARKSMEVSFPFVNIFGNTEYLISSLQVYK